MLQYRRALTVLCVTASFVPCFGQTQATFQTQTQPITNFQFSSENTYAIDVTNDGMADIIQFQQYQNPSNIGFEVYRSNGDGTFTSTYTYNVSNTGNGVYALAFGDFNGDGNVDLVMPMNNTGQVAVFLGTGYGTFQPPVMETVAPAGATLNPSQIAAGDFNHDGKQDIVVNFLTSTTTSMVFIPGNGDGTFGTPSTIVQTPNNSNLAMGLSTGDFDGDGNADVAFGQVINCPPVECGTTVHVAYGNGDGTFTDTTPYTSASLLALNVGDLNSDGRTDIFAIGGNGTQLDVLYGQQDRTLSLYTQTMSQYPYTTPASTTLAMADFDGDDHMDLVTIGQPSISGTTNDAFRFFMGSATPGAFTERDLDIGVTPEFSSPVVENYYNDPYARPSPLFVGGNDPSVNNGAPAIFEAKNTTDGGFWGGCAFAVAGQGIHACDLLYTPSNSTMLFDALGSSFGNLRKIELWVDGTKIAEQYHTWGKRAWFDSGQVPITPGSHVATFVAVNVDNSNIQQTTTLVLNDSGACAASSSPGVNVCSPSNNSTEGSPVQALASATVTGTIQRMEVWVDGMKEASDFNTTTINTSLSVAAGYHRFDYYAVNTAGTKWESTVYVTVP